MLPRPPVLRKSVQENDGRAGTGPSNVKREAIPAEALVADLVQWADQFCGVGEVGLAGAARFFEKNGSRCISIRSRTLFVWSPSYSS